MLEGLRSLFLVCPAPGQCIWRPWTEILIDAFDIFVVAYVLYRLLLILRGTRAMQMGAGFALFGLLYLLAKYAHLETLMSVLSWLAPSIVLIMVVVFQNDIKRALTRMGAKAWLARGREQQTRVIDDVVAAAQELARHRMGAIIAIERDANVLEFARSEGIDMDSLISRELLVSLFIPESVNQTHDGAVLIRDLRIARAGVFFPMPESRGTDPAFGSRHRAAIGITEETDAVVVVVSEERGTITLCIKGSYSKDVDSATLRDTLLEELGHREKRKLMARFRLRRSKDEMYEGDETPASEAKRKGGGAPASERGKVKSDKGKVKSEKGKGKPKSDKPKSDRPKSDRPKSDRPKSDKPKSDKLKSDKLKGKAKPDKAISRNDDGKTDKTRAAAKQSGRYPAQKQGSSQSGRYPAQSGPASVRQPGSGPIPPPTPSNPGLLSEPPPAMTPGPSKVSRPMPSAKERRSMIELPGMDREDDITTTPLPVVRDSISKPMPVAEIVGPPPALNDEPAPATDGDDSDPPIAGDGKDEGGNS